MGHATWSLESKECCFLWITAVIFLKRWDTVTGKVDSLQPVLTVNLSSEWGTFLCVTPLSEDDEDRGGRGSIKHLHLYLVLSGMSFHLFGWDFLRILKEIIVMYDDVIKGLCVQQTPSWSSRNSETVNTKDKPKVWWTWESKQVEVTTLENTHAVVRIKLLVPEQRISLKCGKRNSQRERKIFILENSWEWCLFSTYCWPNSSESDKTPE